MKIKYNIIENNVSVEKILDIDVNDDSYRYMELKGDHNLTLYYSLFKHI